MTQQLPTRPFTPLPPPPGGIAQAVRTGRRMRLRRRLAVAGGALTAVAVVAAAAVFGPASTGATDELVPADRPSASPMPEAIAPVPEQTAVAAPEQPAPATPGAGGAAIAAAPAAPGRPTASASPVARQGEAASASYRTPDLIRTYRADAPTSPVARYCGGTVSNDESTATQAGWCVTASAVKTSAGHDLALQVCRDSTGDARLSFKTRHEAELVVRLGDKVVWRWSTGHANPEERHSLATGAADCWTWTARWTDVDSAGRPLEPDDYTLDAVSTSTQASVNHQQAPIKIR